MKKTIGLLIILLINISCKTQTSKENIALTTKNTQKIKKIQPIYQFIVKDINEKEFEFSQLKGKKIMIVNTASECGLTPQYKELEKLYTMFKNEFTIIGFPANNFGAQEPGTNDEISKFCSVNYGVTFPMMRKISVKGEDMHPLYKYLTAKSLNGFSDNEVKWNFQKYLINEKGFLEAVIDPKTPPTDEFILNWLSTN